MLAFVVTSTALQSQLPMGFTLPFTRLAFKHLRSLSCQRLGPPATLTTWVSTLYVRLTDSLECQDTILIWILTKLYNEALSQNSWNYVLSMRHHHELPLTRIMKLRPDHQAPPCNHRGITSWPMRHHHEISLRDSWNYVLTMRHHHENFVELGPDYTKIMSHQPTQYYHSCQQFITNHPFMSHSKVMPNLSISAHKSSNTCKITHSML